MINIKTFKKSKFIFIFLLLIFSFGIASSLTSFSSSNLNSSGSSTSNRVRNKRQVSPSSPTEVEWNAHMVKIKPVLKTLAEFNEETITFKVKKPGGKKDETMVYSVTNLIKAQNIDAQYSEMSPEAQTELKHFYENKIDGVRLTMIYKNDFLRKMRSTFIMFKVIGVTDADIADVHGKEQNYSWINLTDPDNKRKQYKDLPALAEEEFSKLLANKIDNEKLIEVYKEKVDFVVHKIQVDKAFESMKLPLELLAGAKITEVGLKFYSIGNLTANLDKKGSELVDLAKDEFLDLWANDINERKLNKIYVTRLDLFLDDMKDVLQIFLDIDISAVTIDAKSYSIGHLTANLDKEGSELTDSAKDELIDLLANNIIEEKLQTVYKLKLEPFLKNIKPALLVLKAMGSTEVIITGEPYSISNLVNVLEINDWEIDVVASQELAILYKHNSDSSAVKSEVETAYKLLLEPFLKNIEPALQAIKVMGISKISIAGVEKPFEIGNLIYVVEALEWEKINEDAKTELYALYKHNSSGSEVEQELQIAYKLLLDTFLVGIKPILETFKKMGISQVAIDGKPHLIGELIQALSTTGSKQTGKAKDQLLALCKNSADAQKVKEKLNIFLVTTIDTQNILAFQKNWDEEKVSSYLLWLPVFDIKEVKLSQSEALPVDALATAIEVMLNAEKFDFTKLQGKARKQLASLLNNEGKLREVETFQDDVWKQIKNHQKWKAIEGPLGQSVLESIRTLLLKVQDLGIKKISHPFFPEGYDLSFLQDNPNWKQISFQDLLQGMKVAVNGAYVEFYSDLFPNKVVFQVPMKKLSTVFSEITIANIIIALEKAISAQEDLEILAFQNNWNGGKVSSYLLWLPVFDIKEVKLSQSEALPVDALATAIKAMLNAEKLDFTKLQIGEARKQLLNLLNSQGKLREVKTFQDDVWKQIKNHQKWKAIESSQGQSVLQRIRVLLLKIQDLGIKKISHPFFPEGYDLSFLQDNSNWKQISFQDLLQGMKVAVNGVYVEFYSDLFPNKVVFQVPMKKLSTVFSEITIANIIIALEKAISDHLQQEKKLESKNQGLIIGLSVAGSIFVLAVFGGFLYWFFKVKK